MARRAAVSALLGSAIEYFDFTLFTTASALYLGPVFFARLGSGQAVMASLLTFGLAFVARPLGAVLFGYVGDRRGRRTALLASVTVMGLATLGVGCLPTFAQWGWAAPLVLLALRLAQGLSAGGEQAGSNALTVEHAPDGHRGAYAAWTMQGTALGALVGKLSFLGILALPQAAQLTWGWRLPFLAAGPLLLVTLWIRSRLSETPAFLVADHPASAPVSIVLRHHWKALLLVACGSFYAVGGAVLNVYGLAWASQRQVMGSSTYLWVVVLATVLGLVTQPVWAVLSDRYGRRPVFAGAAVATAVSLVGFFAALSSGSAPLFAIAAAVTNVCWSGCNAVSAALYSELFPTAVRHTGAALGGQLGMILVGFGPAIMAALSGADRAGWVGPAVFAAACLLVAGAAAALSRETFRTPLSALDAQRATGA